MPGEKIEAKVSKALFSIAIGKIEIRIPGLLTRDHLPRPSKHDWHLELAKEAMPPHCHDQLEWIVNNSDVHAECLELACKTKALICKDGRLVLGAALPSYLIAATGVACLASVALYAGWHWLSYDYAVVAQLLLVGLIGACALMAMGLQERFVYSHRVARNALNALKNYGKVRRTRTITRGQK